MRVYGILALAPRRAANVILFAHTSRMKRHKCGKLALDLLNPPSELIIVHAYSIILLSGSENKKMGAYLSVQREIKWGLQKFVQDFHSYKMVS
jgi:hypothetical protein